MRATTRWRPPARRCTPQISSPSSVPLSGKLRDESLTHAVNVIRIGRLMSRLAHVRGDLAAMIRRMRERVCQDVVHRVAPEFSLGVLVRNGLVETAGSNTIQIFLP